MPGENGILPDYLQECLHNLLKHSPQVDDLAEQAVISEAIEAVTRALEEVADAHHRTEAALRQYEEIFDSCPDGYVITDRRGEIQKLSSKAATLLGVAHQDVVGELLENYIVEADRQRFADGRRRVAQSMPVQDWNIKLQSALGNTIQIDLSATPILDADDQENGFRWLIRDVSDQKQMQAELHEVRQRLAESREAERMNLAHELHDSPLQELSTVRWQLSVLKSDLDDQNQVTQIEAMQERIEHTLTTLRAITNDLRPPVLVAFGLEVAVRTYIKECCEMYPTTEITLDFKGDGAHLAEWIVLSLFRIFQQALRNALQHAEATHIQVHLAVDVSNVQLEVIDNGKGFTVPEKWIDLVRNGHLGVAGMAERAETMGGRFEVESKPGQGTRVHVWVMANR